MSATDLLDAPVNYIILAGQASPGIATITNAEALRRLHERRPFGVAGATVVDQGGLLAHPVVNLYLLTRDDLAGWEQWKSLLVRPAQRSTQGMDIEHPLLADLEIRAVLLEGRSQLLQDETGGWNVTIKFCEYRRPTPALSVPASTTTVEPTSEEERQLAAGQIRIDQLTQELAQ